MDSQGDTKLKVQDDPELKILESNKRLAVAFAMKTVFGPSPIRRMLDQDAPRCFTLVAVDQEDKRGRVQTVFESCTRFNAPQTTLLTGDEQEAIIQSYRGGGTNELQFYGTTRDGIMVVCAGFERHVCCMLSGIVIETLRGLTEATRRSL